MVLFLFIFIMRRVGATARRPNIINKHTSERAEFELSTLVCPPKNINLINYLFHIKLTNVCEEHYEIGLS